MKVAVVGLGQMGIEVARRLQASEHELVVFNRTPERAEELVAAGASAAPDAAAAFERSEVCLTLLSDGRSLLDVALGERGLLAAEGCEGKTLIDMSTVDVESSARLAEQAAARGVAYLRCPVSGNPTVVAAGNLMMVVSGRLEDLETVRDLLEVVGPTLFYLGDGESARVMKLALNLILGGTAELIAEALTMGLANGLDKERMLEVIKGSALGSPFVGYKAAALAAEDYSTTFTARQLAKDLDLVIDCANGSNVPVPSAALLRQQVQACVSGGMGELDLTVLVPLLEHQAGMRTSLPVGP